MHPASFACLMSLMNRPSGERLRSGIIFGTRPCGLSRTPESPGCDAEASQALPLTTSSQTLRRASS